MCVNGAYVVRVCADEGWIHASTVPLSISHSESPVCTLPQQNDHLSGDQCLALHKHASSHLLLFVLTHKYQYQFCLFCLRDLFMWFVIDFELIISTRG